jgi:hypothetical protein
MALARSAAVEHDGGYVIDTLLESRHVEPLI